jgi:hypothetical protein
MLTNNMQLFVVQPPNGHESNVKVVVWASGRDDAGRKAEAGWLRGYGRAHEFVITPITDPGDRVKVDITLNV